MQEGKIAETTYKKAIRKRKRRSRMLLIPAFLITLLVSFFCHAKSYNERVRPEIKRAAVQISQVALEFFVTEMDFYYVYHSMQESRKAAAELSGGMIDDFGEAEDGVPEIVDLSWVNKISQLRVGRDGYVIVADRETGEVMTQVDEGGTKYTLDFLNRSLSSRDVQLPNLEDVTEDTDARDIKMEAIVLLPESGGKDVAFGDAYGSFRDGLDHSFYGYVTEYGDLYFAFAVPWTEFLKNTIVDSVFLSLIIIVVLWLFNRYIGMIIDSRRPNPSEIRSKLFSYATVIAVLLFILVQYIQVLDSVTDDLKTMQNHANVAVETLNSYNDQVDEISAWLDEQYLIQCGLARDIIDARGVENVTREDLQKYSESLEIEHIYVFDENGRVIVTNSPYDHLKISTDKEDPSYPFNALLEGADHVILEPGADWVNGEETQYIGVSRRNEEDLADGFVMIDVDPSLRVGLTSYMDLDTVLSNMTVGLPQYALAIDGESLTITATTELGYVGEEIAEFGISEEDLIHDSSTFIHVDGKTYYVGIAKTDNLYLVPLVPKTAANGALSISFFLALISFLSMTGMMMISLYRYKEDVLDAAPPEAIEEPEPAAEELPDDIDEELEQMGLLSNFSKMLKSRQKYFYDDRWHMHKIPWKEQTPEQKIGHVIYNVFLIVCVLILIPQVYYMINSNADLSALSGFSYVLAGNWGKGFNIFSITSLIAMILEMYIFVALMNQLLYRLGMITGMRVETICLLIKNSLKYICFAIFVFYGLAKFGVKATTIGTVAGLLTVVIGFGARDLVNDIISGFFIIFEGSFKVGDFISIGSWYGVVQEIGIRTTKIGFFCDTKIINNSNIREVINSDGRLGRMVLLIPVPYNVSLVKLEKMFAEELPKLCEQFPELRKKPRYQGVDSFEQNCMMIRISIFTDPHLRWWLKRNILRQIKLMFDEYGIEVPVNHIMVHQGGEVGKNAFLTGDEDAADIAAAKGRTI